VFDMDRNEPAPDGLVPAPAAKVGMENEINDTQGAQNRRGPIMCASTRKCICNLELGKEDNLAEVAQANVLTEVTNNNPDNPPTDNQEAVANTAL
jgi:hypothetical protein